MLELNREDEESPAEKRRASPAIGFGTAFAVGMALFGIGGHWLDVKTGHEHFFTLIGIGLGLLYGAWELWKLVAISNQETGNEGSDQTEKKTEQPNEPPK